MKRVFMLIAAFLVVVTLGITGTAQADDPTPDSESDRLLNETCANYKLQPDKCTLEALEARIKEIEENIQPSENRSCGECTTTNIFKKCRFNCPGWYNDVPPYGRVCVTVGC